MSEKRVTSQSIQVAILEHQKQCLGSIQDLLANIWAKIRKISEHQDRLTNDEETGKVDVLWLERETRIREEKERRQYWVRTIAITVLGILATNFLGIAWFLHRAAEIIAAHK